MTNKVKLILPGLALMIAGFSVASVAQADERNKETKVTFSAPVQVPGKVLEAGTYVFKLADNQSDRDIVQIFTEDQTHLVTTILAIPGYTVVTSDKPLINLEERQAGSPEAVKSWVYPGENYGFEFVYPKEAMHVAANSALPAPMTTTSE